MLNHRYFDEPCLRGAPDVVGRKIDRKKFNKMIDEFYAHHGLDKNGVPKPETLKRLGLEEEPSHLLNRFRKEGITNGKSSEDRL